MASAGTILPLKTKLGFGFGSVAYGIKDNGFATFLIFYYNQVIGLRADLAGLIIALALITDAFVDPLIGQLSDRTRSPLGRRHPWLYGAALPIVIFWLLLWHPPGGSEGMQLLYLFLIATAVRISFSAYEVPTLALLPELSSDYHDRTSIMRFRFLFGWGGGLAIMAIAYGVFLVASENQPVGLLNKQGYSDYAWFGAGVMLIAVLLSALATHRIIVAKYHATGTQPGSAEGLADIFGTFRYRPFMLLMLAGIFAFTNQWLTFALTPYLYSHVWGFSQADFTAFALLLFVSAFTAFLIVTPVSRRFGKARSASMMILIALVLGNLPYLLRQFGLFPQLGDASMIPLLFAFLISATAASISAMILTLSMIADVADQHTYDTKKQSEGLFASGMFLMQKVVNGVGILLTGIIISAIGLPEGAKPGEVGPEIVDNFVWIYVSLSVSLALLGAWAYTLFPLGEEDHEARQRGTAAKHV